MAFGLLQTPGPGGRQGNEPLAAPAKQFPRAAALGQGCSAGVPGSPAVGSSAEGRLEEFSWPGASSPPRLCAALLQGSGGLVSGKAAEAWPALLVQGESTLERRSLSQQSQARWWSFAVRPGPCPLCRCAHLASARWRGMAGVVAVQQPGSSNVAQLGEGGSGRQP